MTDYDNSKTFLEFEIQRKIDKQKERGLAKHRSEIRVMDNLLDALNEYMIKFGRLSNAHDLCFDLKKQIEENKKHTQNYMDVI
tara:strand:- start:369 stop:617 length:249 start_codon:yes stop_codon:yes gene_type:complete